MSWNHETPASEPSPPQKSVEAAVQRLTQMSERPLASIGKPDEVAGFGASPDGSAVLFEVLNPDNIDVTSVQEELGASVLLEVTDALPIFIQSSGQ